MIVLIVGIVKIDLAEIEVFEFTFVGVTPGWVEIYDIRSYFVDHIDTVVIDQINICDTEIGDIPQCNIVY